MNTSALAIICTIACKSDVTKTFLTHLSNLTLSQNTQFVFCIDGHVDSKNEELLSEFTKTRAVDSSVLVNSYPMGYSISVNKVMKEVKRDFVLLMDSDVFFDDVCLSKLLNIIKSKNIAAVQPLLVYPQNMTIQSYGHVFGQGFNKHALMGQPIKHIKELSNRKAQALTTACQLFKRELFVSVDGLDETYYNAYEGMEISLKYRKLGFEVMVCGTATAYHFQGKTRSSLTFNESIATSTFWRRWGDYIQSDFMQFYKFEQDFFKVPKYVINISNLQDWKDFKVDYALRSRGKSIECWEELPLDILKYAGDLVFLCDHFSQLSNNKYWFSNRYKKQSTTVLDLHGNQVQM